MLAKKQRLTQAEFAKFFKLGKRHHSPTATLIVAKHPTFHGAVVVSKKVSKKAVTRNTLRRRVYAQLYAASKQKDKNVHIIVLKPRFKDLTRQHQHETIKTLIAEVT